MSHTSGCIPLVCSEQSWFTNFDIQIEVGSELAVDLLFKCYVFIYGVLGHPQEAETHTIDFVMNKLTPSLFHSDVSQVGSFGIPAREGGKKTHQFFFLDPLFFKDK